MDSGGNQGAGGARRPIIQNGMLSWVAPQHPRVGQPVVPFSGQGHRLDQTHGDRHGPLSHQNIGFLRSLADQQQPRYLGMRHTTEQADRVDSARQGGVQRPGFYGDAYSLVPKTTQQRNDEAMMQRFPQLFRGKADLLKSPGFSGSDQEFNRAVEQGIRNSVNWDLARAPGHTVAQRVQHLGDNTQFALVDMGRQPGMRTDATYGASTPSFGKTNVPPGQVFREIGTSGQQLLSEMPHGLRTDRPFSRHNGFEVTESLVSAFGRRINSALDQMRPPTPSRDSPAQRRERMAAAAELRMLQSQSRGRPALREQQHEQVQTLQDIVRAPTR
ncbi:hypothetical protein N8I74_12470 [Chitiniphilus purpureus]|uniref:Uncharacterized protein n=1 Tax=Chitiniphilus purpureus TaxID=2981137 RepID=A0ABY6DIR7_9NEIS|nr:hypothetical protein [Chitiniphilus sp. CD1]UXY14133.1 hypothetical protein N8I74_12470 [Chitiniphilus sp. CD1]